MSRHKHVWKAFSRTSALRRDKWCGVCGIRLSETKPEPKTVQDVYDDMTPTQKEIVHIFVGAAVLG